MTLYGITKEEARVLVDYCNGDIAVLGLLLWDKGRAPSIERGVDKARKLVKFSKDKDHDN